MRHGVFVIGSRDEFTDLAPVLSRAADAGLKYDIWHTGQSGEALDDLVSALDGGTRVTHRGAGPAGSPRHGWWLRALAGCYSHVHSLKIWTRAAPLVIVRGVSASSLLGAIAGRFGGGWVVQLDSGVDTGKWYQGLVCRLTNFALCPGNEAYGRMRRFHCKAVNLAEAGEAGQATAGTGAGQVVDRLREWSR